MTVIEEIAAERRRQIEEEGWTTVHDDQWSNGELRLAAACYSLFDATDHGNFPCPAPAEWPFRTRWWKPTTPRRDLVKAAALVVAEIERLDRAAIRSVKGDGDEGR